MYVCALSMHVDVRLKTFTAIVQPQSNGSFN